MHEKHLLLPSAKSAVIVVTRPSRHARYLRLAALAVGLLCILVGLADLSARAAQALGTDANRIAFGPAVAVTGQGALLPARLSIPAVGIDARIEQVGTREDGTMGTPQDFKNVAWYALGAKPGEAGNAVFAGHVNNALTRSGVFENLAKVRTGDYVTVSDAQGKSLVYKVSDIASYPANEAPAASIFATSGPSQLVLITCDGDWVSAERTYEKRLVIFAKPAY